MVVANAYPSDATLVVVRHKSYAPLRAARPDATRVILASCHSGPGGHGLSPLVDSSTLRQHIRVKSSVMSPSQIAVAVLGGVRRRLFRPPPEPAPVWKKLLYRPGTSQRPELPKLSDLEVAPSWQAVVDTIREHHPTTARIRVVVYPCAPLQVLRPEAADEVVTSAA